jgi:UDP-glucose 4-epimerase
VGGHLARGMSRRGHDVVALMRRSKPDVFRCQPGIRIEQIDLARPTHALAGSYDAILHCAAAIPSLVHDEDDLLRINIESSRRLFDPLLLAPSPVVIFCSSMSVYGDVVDEVVDESTAIHNPSGYGRSKLECERLLDELSRTYTGLRALSIRLPGIVGPGSHDNFLSDTKARLAAGGRVIIRNPEALFNNVIHIDDLECFVEHLLPSLPVGHRVVTVASRRPLPIRETVEILQVGVGGTGEVRYQHGGHPFLIKDERARGLGYVPATVEDAVRRFASN